MSQQPPDRPPEGWGPPPEGPPVPPQGWGQSQQQPGWPPAPGGSPTATQQPPKKAGRGRQFAIGCAGLLVALVLLGIIAALAGGGDDGGSQTATDEPSATTTRTKTTEAPAERVTGIGTPVRDGKFQFTVRKVECGKSRIGTKDFGTTAQGQFCFVHVKVENIGKEAQTLDGSSQYLYGTGGQKFNADTEAAIYLDDAQTFLEEINPGNTVNGIVVFDVPKNAKPAKIELHDSLFSGGVTVEL